MFKIQDIVDTGTLQRTDKVMPLTEATTWLKDFYNMLWNDHLQHDLYLIIEFVEGKSTYPSAMTVLKINKDDGALSYGSYELPVYQYPVKDYDHPELSKKLGYTVSFFINEPKPQADKPKEPEKRLDPEKPLEEEKKFPEERKEPLKEKEVEAEDVEKKDNLDEAFIPNTLKQYDERPHHFEDIIVFYIDQARYLPENVTVSKLS